LIVPCSIHQHETVRRRFKENADIPLLNDQTFNQRTEQYSDSHIDAADENEQEKSGGPVKSIGECYLLNLGLKRAARCLRRFSIRIL
jgi:hypothetical protein